MSSLSFTITEFFQFVHDNADSCIVYFNPCLDGSWSVMTAAQPSSYSSVFHHLYTARGSLRVFSTLDAAVKSVYPLRDISEFHVL